MLAPWKKSYDKSRQHIKKWRHYSTNKDPSSQSYGFSSSHVWMWELDYEESWAPKNWCFWTMVLEKTLESPLDFKEIQSVHPKGDQSLNIHWKDWCWSWNSNALATWYKESTHWKRPWCWERLKAGEGDDRGWDGWMASPMWWTWALVGSRSWWWSGKPGVLQSIGVQRAGHDWATELNIKASWRRIYLHRGTHWYLCNFYINQKLFQIKTSVQFNSITQSCMTLVEKL